MDCCFRINEQGALTWQDILHALCFEPGQDIQIMMVGNLQNWPRCIVSGVWHLKAALHCLLCWNVALMSGRNAYGVLEKLPAWALQIRN